MQLDFSDLYANKSYLSRIMQAQFMNGILTVLQEQEITPFERTRQTIIHGELFAILSSACAEEVIFLAADNLTNQLAASYVEEFRSENILLMAELDLQGEEYYSTEYIEEILESIQSLKSIADKKITLIILPYKVFSSFHSADAAMVSDLLDHKGKILLYDSPKGFQVPDNYTLLWEDSISQEKAIKVLQTNKSFLPSPKNLELTSKLHTILQELRKDLNAKRDDILNKLDIYIREIQIMEYEIIKYRDEFLDMDSKYKINEVKNALIDTKFSEECDFKFFVNEVQNMIYTYFEE
jgi:hypothetical protein